MNRHDLAEGSTLLYRAAFLTICVLLVMPFLTLAYAPLVDYPNHLARVFILSHYDQNPAFRAVFQRDLRIMPNLGIDLVMTPMLSFVSITTASRLFLAATILLFALGCHQLARAVHCRRSWVALPCAFMVLCSPFMFGFVNYTLGVGAFLCTLAAWLRFRERRSIARYLVVCVSALACFLIHLSTLAFLGVAIGVVVALSVLERRKLEWRHVVDGSVLLPLAVAFLVFRPHAGEHSATRWSTPIGKAIGLLTPLRTYDTAVDLALILGWALVFAYAWRAKSSVRIHRKLFAASVVLFIGFLVSPQELFSSAGADTRFVLPAFLLAVMSVELTLPRRALIRLVSASLLLCVARLGALWWAWAQLSDQTAQLVQVTDRLPAGASVFAEQYESGESADARRRSHAFTHVVHYATIRRGAIVSSLFTVPGVQPIRWADGRVVQHMTAANVPELVRPYDFVWTGHAPPDVRAVLGRHASVVAEHEGYELWRVDGATFSPGGTAPPPPVPSGR
jgi:hypothetical protein